MKKIFFLFIAFCVLRVSTFAQAPDIEWIKTIGGIWGDEGYSVQQTLDGGYVITGMYGLEIAPSHYKPTTFLVKLDESGDSIWFREYNDPSSYSIEDWGNSIQQTLDMGYIIAGTDFGGYCRLYQTAFLIKTDQIGEIVWKKTWGLGSAAISVKQTFDKGFIFTGYDESPLSMIKTNANGETLWSKTFGGTGPGGDTGYLIQPTIDAGYIVIGSTKSCGAGKDDIWLIKTDANGDTLWTKTIGGTTCEEGYSGQQTIDGGFIIVGYTDSYGAGGRDVWLIKTDENGDTIWTRTYGGVYDEEGFSVCQTLDSGYVIAGCTNSFGSGNDDVWIIKTNNKGDTLWTKTIDGESSDCGRSIQQTTDRGYIVTGYTNPPGSDNSDVWIIKLKSDIVGMDEDVAEAPEFYNVSQNYPNPFNPTTKIKYSIPQLSNVVIKVFDILGNEIETLVNDEKPAGIYEITWNAEKFPSGVYFYQIKAGNFIQTKKMILLK